ncbi:MAG: hypothetical protein ACE5FR_04635 [Rhodospirillales bacterium]
MVTAITSWTAFDPAGAGSAAAVSGDPPDAPGRRVLVAQANAESATRRQLLEQKVALLANYLKSAMTRRIAGGDNAQAKARVRRAEALLGQARHALGLGDEALADRLLNEALRTLSAASRLAVRGRRADSEAQARTRYERLRRHIDSYLKSASEGSGGTGADTVWQSAATKLTASTAEAEALAADGRYVDASKLLAKTYRAVVAAIAESRRGQTVISSLRFAGPEDEFDYERRRNDSYEMLLELMLSERQGTATGALRALVERSVAESRSLRGQADHAAAAGDYQTAIDAMEEATRRLTRALRAGGLRLPE